MFLSPLFQFFSFLALTALSGADEDFCGNHGADADILTRDVLIIGGGSAGTYTAIRLKAQGKSVAVVEKNEVLGGHTNTYVDPVTNAPVDYGVQVFENTALVHDYFNHLNVSLTTINLNSSPFTTYVADFTANVVTPQSALPAQNVSQGVGIWAEQLAKYPYIDDGFNLPNPIPDDLLLPFGSFVQKYNLQAFVGLAFQYCQGYGNILAIPTLYVMKVMGPTMIAGLQNGFLTTAEHDNSALYEAALGQLGSDALLSSQAMHISRDDDWIRAWVQTPTGNKLVQAKKLVIATPPMTELLGFLDLDDDERGLFNQFSASYYYTSVIRNSGIPDNVTINAFSESAPDGVPALPVLYSALATGVPQLHIGLYGATEPMAADTVKANILSSIAEAIGAGQFPPASGPATTIEVFNDHSPFAVGVSADAVRAGFYTQVNGLQGRHNTWYTGAAWQSEDSGLIWEFTENRILPALLS